MVSGEILIHLQENIDSLEHTRKCITENLVNGIRCKCGLQKIIDSFMEYQQNLWKENREF